MKRALDRSGSKLVAELLGTMIFVILGAGSIVAASYLALPPYIALLVIALGNGMGLGLAVSMTMNISGGHLNPAVTLGVLIAGKIRARQAVAYWAMQLTGATLGALLLLEFFTQSVGASVLWGAPALGASVSVLQGIAVEAIMTFILVFAVFGTAVDRRAPKIGGLGIGLAVVLDVFIGGNLTGAAMNPARWFGPALVSMSFSNWYVYIIGPAIGAAVASYIYSRFLL